MGIFKDREFVVRTRKAGKYSPEIGTLEERTTELDKYDRLIKTVEDLGTKAFVGGLIALVGYVILDTYRQVEVAKVIYDKN